jgi:cobalt-zinc-cadmium efflux system membrane fusion protein
MKPRSVTLLFSCGAFLCLLLTESACTKKSAGSAEAAPAMAGADEIVVSPQAGSALRLEPATMQSEQTALLLPGTIQDDDDHYSKVSSPVVGRITEIRAKLGDRVAAGDPLVVIESPDIGTAFADYVKARSDLATAGHALDLAKDLYAGKALSRRDLQQAQNDQQKAEAEFSRTQERLLNLHVPNEELDRPMDQQQVHSTFALRAPIPGTVIERAATLGEVVGSDPAQTLFTIADLSTLIVIADLAEKDLARVAVGQHVSITADAYPGRQFTGRVAYISDMVDPNTRTVKLRCQVDNSQHRLKPDMFVRISLSITPHGPPLPAVPLSALLHEGNQYVLFVRTGPNRFVRRVVAPATVAGSTAMIREGLHAGDEVVTDGALLLENLSSNPT